MRRSLVLVAAMGAGTVGCNDVSVVPTFWPSGCAGDGGFVLTKMHTDRVQKVDVLVVVDDSATMADAQAELARRLPELLTQLADPTPDPRTHQPTQATDLHVAVITSSLGSFGTSVCAGKDDRAHVLPRPGACTSVTASPLRWVFDPAVDPAATFKGAEGLGAVSAATSCVVESAGQSGCGFAQPWEALYRFLIDPAPYAKAAVNCTAGPTGDACGNNDIIVTGRDEDLLAQRAAFLRPDSLVVVVVLSDQNDVSLRPAGKNWLPFGYPEAKMQRGWEACEGLPDDLEPGSSGPLTALGCFSCFQDDKNPNCTKPWSAGEDAMRLRGFHQVQRFGFDFLWSRERYVNAFKNTTVPGSDGRLGPNTLFSGGFRDPSLVFVAGIVGVPKQLVEDGGKPKVLSTADWEKLTGPVAKRDPHLIESVGPRAGLPLFAGDRSVDPVHGGERLVPGVQQLQAACIKARPSTPSLACAPLGSEAVDPLCEPGGKQAFTQAYPGLRHLRILEQLGPSGLVASICSETLAPTMTAIATRVRAILGARCLRTIPPAASADRASCSVFAVLPDLPAGKTCETLTGVGGGTGYCTPGSAPCRKAGDFLGPSDREKTASQLAIRLGKETLQATVEGENVIVQASDGTRHLVCELLQLSADRTDAATSQACRTDPGFAPAGGGYCYSSDPAMIGDVCLHEGATSTLRFVGDVQPQAGTEIFPVCGKC